MGNVVPSPEKQAECEEWENLTAKFHFHAGFWKFTHFIQKRKQLLASSGQSKLIPSHKESSKKKKKIKK